MKKRILWVNPVGWDAYDRPIGEVLSSVREADTEIEVVSLGTAEGFSNVEYRSYETIAEAEIVRIAYDAGQRGVDAMIIGCFHDPAIHAAREVSGDTIVVGPFQAALNIATTLANRFSILTVREKVGVRMREVVAGYGATEKLASIRPLGIPVDQLQADHDFTRARIVERGRQAIEEDGAEAILLGCTNEHGFFQKLQDQLGVPVIDAVCAPFKLAEHMATLKLSFGWKPSRVGSSEPPPLADIARFGMAKPAIGARLSF